MTGDTDIVGKNRVAPHYAVVSNVHIGHEQIIAANSRQPAAGLGAAMQVRPFAQDIVIANLKPGFFAMKFLICGVFTDRTKLENSIVLANLCVGANHDMGVNNRTRTNLHIGAYDSPGPYRYIGIYFSFRINPGTGINRHPPSSLHT